MMNIVMARHILGLTFFSTMSISISFMLFILPIFIMTGWEGVQNNIGECIIASSITSVGWFHLTAK